VKGIPDADHGRLGLDSVVALAHCHLGLDVVVLVELTPSGQVHRALAGDLSSFEALLREDDSGEQTYCEQLVAGEIPNLIHDAGAEERVSRLAVTRKAPIGSFIGVPVRLSDGTS
jgi:GAF domain-containing protein